MARSPGRAAAGAPPPPPPGPHQHRQQQQKQQDSQVQSVVKEAHEDAPQDRRALAVSLLTQGRASAFVTFFMLSAGEQQQHPGSTTRQQKQQQLPWPTLVLLQEQLARADAADAAGDAPVAFDAHCRMAQHFTQLGVLSNAVFFWKRALGVAVTGGWALGELQASAALGLLYESEAQPTLAVACHERCLQLSRALQRQQDEAAALAQLVQVYAQQAEARAREGDSPGAELLYARCRDASLQCGDVVAAGAAAHHLGLLSQQRGDWQAALEHQRAFLEISRQAGDQEVEGRACIAYAECQQQLGDSRGAIQSLEAFLQLSRSQAPRGQATACCKLGVLYQQQGQPAQAVAYLERCFELARSLGERRLLDLARANLGAARAALQLAAYADLALTSDSNLEPLLAWKCSRRAF